MDVNWFIIFEQVLYVVVTITLGFIIKFLKDRGYIQKLEQIKIDNELKKAATHLGVLTVQQLYKDLNGEEKYNHAVEFISKYLSERGIALTETEIRILIESSVLEAKKIFGENWNK